MIFGGALGRELWLENYLCLAVAFLEFYIYIKNMNDMQISLTNYAILKSSLI